MQSIERKKNLVVFGFGGHARSVADVALTYGYSNFIFIDENARPDESFLGYSVRQSLADIDWNQWDAMPAAGDNLRRSLQHQEIEKIGLVPAILISPMASIGVGSQILPGCFIGHHAHIGPMAKIGSSCIINTAALVEHESCVGDFSHVSVNATIAGRSNIGKFVMLGAGAIIIDSLSVVDSVVIGAGAVVNTSIQLAGSYVGVPVRKIK